MTVEEAKKKVLDLARQELGYHESGDNSVKYNAGSWDDTLYGWNTQGSPWCDIFFDWLFVESFGLNTAANMTYQFMGCNGAACKESAYYYKNRGEFYQYPEVGDQIFYYYSGDINHTGIVEEVEDSYVVAIEGNSSDQVKRNTYSRSNSIIAGYGRPRWDIITTEANTEDTDSHENADSEVADSHENADSEETTEFKSGDLVKVKAGSTWYNGANIASFVFDENWVVYSVNGDRVVLNWNEAHDNSIMSPVEAKDLILVDGSELPKPETVLADGTVAYTHTVEKGETLWGIAFRELGDGARYSEIVELNGLDSFMIYPGQVLALPIA